MGLSEKLARSHFSVFSFTSAKIQKTFHKLNSFKISPLRFASVEMTGEVKK